MKRKWAVLVSVFASAVIFNLFAEGISDINARIRTFVVSANAETRSFDQRGLPIYRNARVGEYRSPFYVVHYGLEYSEACPQNIEGTNSFHWIPDETLKYWHSSPLDASIELFKHSVDWVVENTEYDEFGNAHLFYHFDWPYPNHPGGILRAPWWSGLTEGHAITLLLRAADCFDDPRYVDLAGEFYRSVIAPVSQGGSMLTLNGLPWIEEYVDPSADEDKLSRVFNGMAYGYFGVTAYERYIGVGDYSERLRDSILRNIDTFDMGFWSYYDAIGSESNIKYHRINLALLEDSRLSSLEAERFVDRWHIGASLPVFFYSLYGPFGYARLQYILSIFLMAGIIFGILHIAVRFRSSGSRK